MTSNSPARTVNGSRSRLMTVGEMSRRTGVPIKNLREYTDTGLIYTVGRSPSNYRLYDVDALWCVRWIGKLRGLGLTLAEIRELTAAHARRSFGPQLAERLHASRQRLQARSPSWKRPSSASTSSRTPTTLLWPATARRCGTATHDAQLTSRTCGTDCLTLTPG